MVAINVLKFEHLGLQNFVDGGGYVVNLSQLLKISNVIKVLSNVKGQLDGVNKD